MYRRFSPLLSGLVRNSWLIKFCFYSLIGSVAFAVDYGIFLAMLTISGSPYIANILGICCGISVSFTLNSRYNFRRRDAMATRGAKFVAVAVFGMALSTAIIALLIRNSFDPRVAKAVAMLLVFVAQFRLNSLWTFR